MTDELKNLMKSAFSNCLVMDNAVIFLGGNFTEEQIRQIYIQFSTDLLDYNIPHYRVVGIKWLRDIGEGSIFRINRDYGMSIIELAEKAQMLVPSKLAGNDLELGCHWSVSDTNVKDIMGDAYMKMFECALKVPREDIGQLMHFTMTGDMQDNSEISSDTIIYSKVNLVTELENDPGRPEFLVKHVHIGRLWTHGVYGGQTTFFYMKGTGKRTYADNSKLFTYESEVFPCNTIYDLSRFVVVGYPMAGSTNSLPLIFREDVDKDVLTEILKEYGRGFGE